MLIINNQQPFLGSFLRLCRCAHRCLSRPSTVVTLCHLWLHLGKWQVTDIDIGHQPLPADSRLGCLHISYLLLHTCVWYPFMMYVCNIISENWRLILSNPFTRNIFPKSFNYLFRCLIDNSFDISKFIQSIYPCIAHEELNICKDTTTKVSKWLLTTEYL